MTYEEKIVEVLSAVAVLKQQEVYVGRISLMAQLLTKFKLDDVLGAINRLLIKSKSFPDISEIINEMYPQPSDRDLAINLAEKIVLSRNIYGPDQNQEAEDSLGGFCWDAVNSGGGWQQLCAIEEDQITTVKAQLRDYILTRLSLDKELKQSLLPERNIKLLDF